MSNIPETMAEESEENGDVIERTEDWKEKFMSCLAVPVFANMRRQEAIALRDANKPDTLYRLEQKDR